MAQGEHVGNLQPPGTGGGGGGGAFLTSLDFSATGEYLLSAAMDGKARVWSVDRAACVATHAETGAALWCARWLPRRGAGGEGFVAGGANRSLTFYREATGA
jgi:superkiller protein 8